MQKLWQKLENLLKKTNSSILADLAPPATDAEISNLEEKIGVKLPEDFLACLKVHNGQRGNADGLFNDAEFLSTSRIFQIWEIMKDIFESGVFEDMEGASSIDGIKGEGWNLKWIPIIDFGNGDICFLDLDPAEDGEFGQVVQYWHEDIEVQKEANNFTEWLSNFTDQLDQ